VQPSVRLKPPPSDAKELDYFAGVWNEQGGWKACVISQEGWFSTQYRNQWTKGHLSSSWTGSGRSGQEILSYDSKQGVYKWHDDGTPGKDDWKGKLKGKTWTWTGEVGRLSNGRMVKGRYTEKEGTPSSYSFWFEISVKGGPWKKVMEGNANRLFR